MSFPETICHVVPCPSYFVAKSGDNAIGSSTLMRSAAEFLTTGPAYAAAHLLLAHGAGSPMTSPFLEAFAMALGGHGIAVHRFEFAYMAARRGPLPRRRPPPPVTQLATEYVARAQLLHRRLARPIAIGGKSMGGRIATAVADKLCNDGVVHACICLGYPFHPVGKPDRTRTDHLEFLRTPTLIIQGERDPFGSRTDVDGYALSRRIELKWIEGGDHDFRSNRSKSRVIPSQPVMASTRPDPILAAAAWSREFVLASLAAHAR